MSVIGSPVVPSGGGASAQGIGFGWADYADNEYTSGSPFSLLANTDTEFPNNGQAGVKTYEPADITADGGMYIPSHLIVTGISGTFQVGETITGGTSSDTAVITVVDTANSRLFLESLNGDFQNAETITGGTSGATATVSGTRVAGKINGQEGDAYLTTLSFKATPTNAGTTYLEAWFDIGGAVGELYRRIVSFPKGNGVERPITMSTGVYTLDTWEANQADVFVRANGTANLYDLRIITTRLFKAS